MVRSFTLALRPAPAGSVSCCCRVFSFCDRRKPALCSGAVLYSRVVSGSCPLCVAVLSFTLVLCPASARSVSWCCRLLVCVRHQQALCRGAVVYSRFVSGSSQLCVAVLSFTLVLCPARSALWCCRLVSFCVRLQPVLCRGASWTIITCSNFGLNAQSVASSMQVRSHAA